MAIPEFQLPFAVPEVTCIEWPGIGPIYRGELKILYLYQLLRGDKLKYAPKYQRGYKNITEDIAECDYNRLLPLDHADLQIDWKRCQEMAVKYLRGQLYNSDIIWNARKTNTHESLFYATDTRTLYMDLLYTVVTIPDSGHRHGCYYTLGKWYEDPSSIPDSVEVDKVPVARADIAGLLRTNFKPHYAVLVHIYNLLPAQEGKMFDEFNTKGKKVSTAQSIGLNMDGTPTRRFVGALMDTTKVLAPREIELHRNAIGGKSRKLTSVATLEAAAKPIQPLLVKLENQEIQYDSLVKFMAAFFDEWACHFPVWQPDASAEARHAFREESFALSNVIFYPLVRLAVRFWDEYRTKGVDWHTASDWKGTLGKIAGDSEVNIDGKPLKVNVMSRKNPSWVGKIVLESISEDGTRRYSLSNTRPSHDAAYKYMCEVAGLEAKASSKKGKKDR